MGRPKTTRKEAENPCLRGTRCGCPTVNTERTQACQEQEFGLDGRIPRHSRSHENARDRERHGDETPQRARHDDSAGPFAVHDRSTRATMRSFATSRPLAESPTSWRERGAIIACSGIAAFRASSSAFSMGNRAPAASSPGRHVVASPSSPSSAGSWRAQVTDGLQTRLRRDTPYHAVVRAACQERSSKND